MHLVVIDDGIAGEFQLPFLLRPAAEGLAVIPGPDDQVLILGRRRRLGHPLPVVHGARLVGIEPPRRVHGRDIDFPVVLRGELNPLPVVIDGVVLEPFPPEPHLATHHLIGSQ